MTDTTRVCSPWSLFLLAGTVYYLRNLTAYWLSRIWVIQSKMWPS